MDVFELQARAVEEVAARKARGIAAAAARIEAKLKVDATSRIGKVPDGISVSVTADGISVNAPDWVMLKAQEKNEPAQWRAIVAEEIERALNSP